MRIAVLGSQGQLGRDLLTRLPGEVVPLTRAEIDLAQPDTVARGVAAAKADVLVNCAAYNFVDKAETEPDAAFAVNARGVRDLATAVPRPARNSSTSAPTTSSASTPPAPSRSPKPPCPAR